MAEESKSQKKKRPGSAASALSGRMMPKNNEFFDQVYQVVRLVPKGRVTTYGAIGKFLGSPKSARMVGWAMNNSHQQSPSVPAHRVVNRNGILTGKHHFSNNNFLTCSMCPHPATVRRKMW